MSGEIGSGDEVVVAILVDNNPGGRGLKAAWGFSALVKVGSLKILFDSGPDPRILGRNAGALGADLSDVDFAVVSHGHWDHAGGLPRVAEVAPGTKVYLPGGISPGVVRWIEGLGLEPITLGDPTALAPGVTTTGSMRGPPSEHGLVVSAGGLGSVLLTGCAHPGIEEMMERAADLAGRVYAAVGGFHLASAGAGRLEGVAAAVERLGLGAVFPVHCSGDRARSVLARRLPGVYGDGHVGMVVGFSSRGWRRRGGIRGRWGTSESPAAD